MLEIYSLASMNDSGNFFSSLDDVVKITLKETTSKESLKSIAISGLTAAATAGLTSGVNYLASGSSSTSTIAGNTTLANPMAAYAPASSTFTTTATNAATTFREAAINTVASSAVQSAVNGQSLTDALKNSAKNIFINAAGQALANQIGGLAHNGDINTATQLTLHAGLGCAMGAAANGSGGCGAGAAAGVVGELSAGFADKTLGLNDNQIKQFSGLTGATAALITSVATGEDDKQSAKNILSGQTIGTNAAANNYLMPKEKSKLVEELDHCGANQGCKDQVQAKYQAISEPRDKEFDKLYADCSNDNNCTEFNKIHYDLRNKLTKEGNDYYRSLTPERKAEEFKLLPPDASIFHTYQQDSSGKVINVKTGGEQGYQKYVHPVYGYEIVLDANKNIVTKPLNAGTYNFYNPNLGMNNTLLEDRFGGKIGGLIGNHKQYDVDPYYLLGNSSNDPTTKQQRSDRNIYYFNQLIK